jgi:hypothetical protein
VFIVPPGVHVVLAGSYISVLDNAVLLPCQPPAMITLPLGGNVAEGAYRYPASEVVTDHDPMFESHDSTVARSLCPAPMPPAIKTRPLARSVAVWRVRPCFMGTVVVQVPVAGLYNSALERNELFRFEPVLPPVISTFPFGNKLAE